MHVALFLFTLNILTTESLVSTYHNYTLDILRLHKNNVFGRFESENHAVSHVHSQLNDLLDSESIHYHVQNNFIITVATGFDFDRMRAAIGSGKIESFSDRHLLISTEPATLKLLLAANQDIVHAVPVVSAMKVSDSVYSSGSIECEGLASASKKLMLESAALSPDDLHTFLDSLHTLSSALSPPLAFADSDLVPHRRSFLKIAVPCEHYLTTALSLAQLRQVLWIEHFNEFIAYNYWVRGVLESGVYSDVAILSFGNLTGAGQIIGVADTGLDIYNNYFYDESYSLVANAPPNSQHRKIVSYLTGSGGQVYGDFSDVTEGHGTHVCGIAAGKAVNNYGEYQRFNGAAPDAKLSFFDIMLTDRDTGSDGTDQLSTPSDLNNNLLVPLYNTGARILSQSWGSENFNTGAGYDGSAKQVDTFICSHPEVLVLFSAGNSGDAKITIGSPVEHTITSPAIFKNGLAIGAGLNDAQSWEAYIAAITKGSGTTIPQQGISSIAAFSSRGPTFDGRIKPDLIGPGAVVYSASGKRAELATPHTGITNKQGTSMATPAVAGIAATVRQYFMEGYYYPIGGTKSALTAFTPSAALLRAMLAASTVRATFIYYTKQFNAQPVDTSYYPSNDQGYGRVQINKVLNFGPATSKPLSLTVIGDTNTSSPLYRSFTYNGEVHTYNFSVSSFIDVKVVLAYTDCPGASSSSMTVQTSLNLSVSGGDKMFFPSIAPGTANVTNTMSWLLVPRAATSTLYTVYVACASLAVGVSEQPYALVLVGDVKELPPTTETDLLAKSNLQIEALPFADAITGMSVVAGLLLCTLAGVIVVEFLAGKGILFDLHKW